MIDSHSHLTSTDFDIDRFDVLMTARAEGLTRILVAGNNFSDSQSAVDLAALFPFLDASAGLHPHEAVSWNDSSPAQFRKILSSCVAIGETGLDYYYNYSSREQQIIALKGQLELALTQNLPVILHCRDAYDDLMKILPEIFSKNNPGGVVHCFNGSSDQAAQLIEMGFLLGFGGMLTFKRSTSLQKVFEEIPMESILLETDCPFLAPVPHRGKRNEPKYVAEIYKLGAKLKNISVKSLSEKISNNYHGLFHPGESIPNGAFVYQNNNRCYINLTNDCLNRCRYCIRKTAPTLWGYNLWLKQEPSVDDVLEAIPYSNGIKEIVFCGYGEPLLRYKKISSISKCLIQHGIPIRINTSGHLPATWNAREIVQELSPYINTIEVSLGNATAQGYSKQCQPLDDHPETVFSRVLEFVKICSDSDKFAVRLSVVTHPDTDLQACRNLADSLNLILKERSYIE